MIGKTQAKRLQERIEANRERRQKEIEKSRPYKEREREVTEALSVIPRMDFWCEACAQWDRSKGDIVAVARKQVKYHDNDLPQARYTGFCPKGHMVMRFITEKNRDPYYRQSFKMYQERKKAADDLLQPSDPRFKQVYPQAWEKLQAEQRAREEQKDIEEYNKKHAGN